MTIAKLTEALRLKSKYAPGALLFYALLSFGFFGRGLYGHLTDRCIGAGIDPGEMIWFFEWWHYSITHHLNPFYTHLVWAPSGYNLAATQFFPLAGIVAFPVTHWLGPVAAYNLVMLSGPPLGAWTAFLLCRYLRLSVGSSLVGGYIFGFSPYMLSHMLGHTSLIIVPFVPLAVLIGLRWLQGDLTPVRFCVLMTLVLTGQALCSLEVLATGTLLSGIALAIAYGLECPEIRRGFWQTVMVLACSYAATAVILSPYLYYFFAYGKADLPEGIDFIAAQPRNMIIPSVTTLVGQFRLFADSLQWQGLSVYEVCEFVGLPLFGVVLSFSLTRRREQTAKFLVYLLLVIWTLSLKVTSTAERHAVLAEPWHLFSSIPLMRDVIPERLCLFSFLLLAVIAGLWLNDSRTAIWLRAVAAASILLMFLPNPSTRFWTIRLDTPSFFRNGTYRNYLSPGDNVVILPYTFLSNSDLWQAQSGMYFRMAGGYIGLAPTVPQAFQNFSIVPSLGEASVPPDAALLMKAFVGRNRINAIVLADQGEHVIDSSKNEQSMQFRLRKLASFERDRLEKILAGLGIEPVRVADVLLYKIPPGRFARYAAIDTEKLELDTVRERLAVLARAASLYTASHHDSVTLTPFRAAQAGFLPPQWITTGNPDQHLADGLLLTSLPPKDIVIGTLAPKVILETLARQYQERGAEVALLPPAFRRDEDPLEAPYWMLVVELNPNQLVRAANQKLNNPFSGALRSSADSGQ